MNPLDIESRREAAEQSHERLIAELQRRLDVLSGRRGARLIEQYARGIITWAEFEYHTGKALD